ncbi:signal peptidase complex catalytic subunit SEC11A-like [Ptychodera flava]|uniref:signal peptidase complex catalytic subunit SEC11A-like n=1 Tax=Ptychodera flava TaxID=63121 RepID=UPI00396A16BC
MADALNAMVWRIDEGLAQLFPNQLLAFVSYLWVAVVLLRSNPITCAVVSSGKHSVANKGDMLILSKVTPGSFGVDDVIVVKDPSRQTSLYVQKVTSISYDPQDPLHPDVQIQYQPVNSEKLGRRWLQFSDVVSKVEFRVPYLGMLNALVHEYPTQIMAALLVYITRPWEYLTKRFGVWMYGSLVFLCQITPVS